MNGLCRQIMCKVGGGEMFLDSGVSLRTQRNLQAQPLAASSLPCSVPLSLCKISLGKLVYLDLALKISIKACNKNRKKLYLRYTEYYSLEENFSKNAEELLQRSVVFNTVSDLVRKKKHQNKLWIHTLKVSQKIDQMYKVSMALAPGKRMLSWKEVQHCLPGSEEFNLYFNIDSLYCWSFHPFL